jgi:hypothetical protein
MGDRPNSFLHKIAGIVPGFNGYMDRERRRDADKLLRTYLAHQYSSQRDRLTRVQQSILRSGQLSGISEVDRLVGVLQRFIDRLTTATYGYSGLFDPVKVEEQDLDQLYAFDMALTSGVDDVSSAIGAIETALTGENAKTDGPTAVSHLASVLDDLNTRLNQRGDLLTTGRGLPTDQYNSLVNSLSGSEGAIGIAPVIPPVIPPASPPSPTPAPYTGAAPQYTSGTPSTGAPTVNTSGEQPQPQGGDMARYPGSSYSSSGVGTDTGSAQPEMPRYPTTGDMDSGSGGTSTTDLSGGGTSDYGIKTASSPATGPTNRGGDVAGDLPPTGADMSGGSGAMDSSGAGDASTDLSDAPGDKPTV